jgi:hypothetical protein
MTTTDLITITEAKQEIGAISTAVDDVLLASYVAAVSEMIDRKCGPVVARTITAEVHDVGQVAELRLRTFPVLSVSSVVEYSSLGVATTLAADTPSSKHDNGYWINTGLKFARKLERRNAGVAYTFPPFGQVVVSYSAGRCASTATVPDIFKHAARLAVATNWSIQQGSGSMTFGVGDGGFGAPIPIIMPRAVDAMLAAEMLPGGIG